VLEKIAEILTVARKPMLKHPLLSACNLPSGSKYVQKLVQWELLDIYPAVGSKFSGRRTRHRMLYQTSQKGELFLKLYKGLTSLMSENHLVSRFSIGVFL